MKRSRNTYEMNNPQNNLSSIPRQVVFVVFVVFDYDERTMTEVERDKMVDDTKKARYTIRIFKY